MPPKSTIFERAPPNFNKDPMVFTIDDFDINRLIIEKPDSKPIPGKDMKYSFFKFQYLYKKKNGEEKGNVHFELPRCWARNGIVEYKDKEDPSKPPSYNISFQIETDTEEGEKVLQVFDQIYGKLLEFIEEKYDDYYDSVKSAEFQNAGAPTLREIEDGDYHNYRLPPYWAACPYPLPLKTVPGKRNQIDMSIKPRLGAKVIPKGYAKSSFISVYRSIPDDPSSEIKVDTLTWDSSLVNGFYGKPCIHITDYFVGIKQKIRFACKSVVISQMVPKVPLIESGEAVEDERLRLMKADAEDTNLMLKFLEETIGSAVPEEKDTKKAKGAKSNSKTESTSDDESSKGRKRPPQKRETRSKRKKSSSSEEASEDSTEKKKSALRKRVAKDETPEAEF